MECHRHNVYRLASTHEKHIKEDLGMQEWFS